MRHTKFSDACPCHVAAKIADNQLRVRLGAWPRTVSETVPGAPAPRDHGSSWISQYRDHAGRAAGRDRTCIQRTSARSWRSVAGLGCPKSKKSTVGGVLPEPKREWRAPQIQPERKWRLGRFELPASGSGDQRSIR